jgi:hypothetical protein
MQVGAHDRAARLLLGAFAFVSIYFVNLFPRFRNPNEFSRYELVVSMAERGSFSIGPELRLLGDHEDKAIFAGKFYSNKAPGLSFAGLPFYFIFRAVLGPAAPGNSIAMIYLLRVATVTASVLVALYFLSRRLARGAKDGSMAALALFAAAFGTPLLVYARSFFSHAWAAALLYLSFECLHAQRERRWLAPLAGLLAGWAVLSEYPAAVVAAVLLLDAAWRRPLRGLSFLAGAAPAALLLGYYDLRCFGGVFELSSRHEWFGSYTSLSREALVGLGVPSPRVAAAYLFSPARGLLFASPFFLFLPAATFSARSDVRAVSASLAAVALYFVVMCGYENWHGGWALGSRYLVPVILLAAWPLSGLGGRPGLTASKWVFAVLACYSAAYFFFSGSTCWALPHEPPLGVRFYSGYWMSKGWFAPTLFGASLPALLPALAATGAAAWIAAGPLFGGGLRRLLVIAAGTCLFALLFVGPAPRGRYGDRLTRTVIFDGYSDMDSGYLELRDIGREAKTPSEREAWRRALAYSGVSF